MKTLELLENFKAFPLESSCVYPTSQTPAWLTGVARTFYTSWFTDTVLQKLSVSQVTEKISQQKENNTSLITTESKQNTQILNDLSL